jgi:hypothetical protein
MSDSLLLRYLTVVTGFVALILVLAGWRDEIVRKHSLCFTITFANNSHYSLML